MPSDLTRREIEELATRCRKAIAPLPYQERRLQPVLRCARPPRFAAVEVPGWIARNLVELVGGDLPEQVQREMTSGPGHVFANWPAAQLLQLCEAALERPGSKCTECEVPPGGSLACSTCTPQRPGKDSEMELWTGYVDQFLQPPETAQLRHPRLPGDSDQVDALRMAFDWAMPRPMAKVAPESSVARRAPRTKPKAPKPRTYDLSNLRVELGGIPLPIGGVVTETPDPPRVTVDVRAHVNSAMEAEMREAGTISGVPFKVIEQTIDDNGPSTLYRLDITDMVRFRLGLRPDDRIPDTPKARVAIKALGKEITARTEGVLKARGQRADLIILDDPAENCPMEPGTRKALIEYWEQRLAKRLGWNNREPTPSVIRVPLEVAAEHLRTTAHDAAAVRYELAAGGEPEPDTE